MWVDFSKVHAAAFLGGTKGLVRVFESEPPEELPIPWYGIEPQWQGTLSEFFREWGTLDEEMGWRDE